MSISSGMYAADGSFRVSIVNGSSYTGLYAADGSLNVVTSNGSSYVGAQHPCGALWVTYCGSAPTIGIRAADGSLNVSTSPYYLPNTHPVTAVSGSFVVTTPGAVIPILVP